MKLYHFPLSPNCRRVLATAFHLGVPLELEEVDLMKGEHLQPSFIRINPNHKVPTLVDGDFVLWESSAIMLYLASMKPGNTLWSDQPREQADINRWLFWNVANWAPACGIFIFEHLVKEFTRQGPPDPVELEKGNMQFHRFAAVLDDHLKRRAWLVDDRITLADYAVAAVLELAESAHLPVGKYRNIGRWYGNVEELEAWKKSAPANFMKTGG